MSLPIVGDDGQLHSPRPLEEESEWTLTICGEVKRPRTFSLEEIDDFEQKEISLSLQCVSIGKLLGRDEKALFRGVSLCEIAQLVEPSPSVQTIGFYSKAPGACGPKSESHHTYLKRDYCLSSPYFLLARSLNGKPLPYANGGPLRTVVGPDRYFYKSVKWLGEIHFLSAPLEEKRGTWERFAGYHNRARVSEKERFEPFFREIKEVVETLDGKEEVLRALPESQWEEIFHYHWKNKNLSRLVVAQIHRSIELPRDFSDCTFSDPPYYGKFRGVNFKQCSFLGANLEGANFSLSQFPAAQFSEKGKRAANLEGADFEGAQLIGAHLEGVSLKGAHLAGSRFYPRGPKKRRAYVKDMNLKGAKGLDEKQKKWLIEDGAIC